MKYQSIYIAAALAASSYAKSGGSQAPPSVHMSDPLPMIINFSHEVNIEEVLESPHADTQLLKVYHSQDCDGKATYRIAGDGEHTTKVDGLTPVYDGSYYQQFFNDFSVELPPRTLLQVFNGVIPNGRRAPDSPDTLYASYFNEEEGERVCVNFNKSDELADTLLTLAF